MNDKGSSKEAYKEEEDNEEEEGENAFNSDLLINIPPDEENYVDEITYGMDDMKLGQDQSTKSNIDNPNQFISESLLKKLEANTPMTKEGVFNLQQDYLKLNLKEDSESGMAQMTATTPLDKKDMALFGQGPGYPSTNPMNKGGQQFKYNSNRQPNTASPICSYFNTNQKMLSEFFFQNEDSRERSNFVKKQPYEKQSSGLGSSMDPKDVNSLNNPLMNMNFNFFNQNVDSLVGSPVKPTSPLMIQQEMKRMTNAVPAKEKQFIDLKGMDRQQQPNFYSKDSDDEASANYTAMLKQGNPPMAYHESNSPNYNVTGYQPFPFPEDFNQDFLIQPPKLNSEDYIFEKFEKRGWECEKCNNFNFESKHHTVLPSLARVKCNRCGVPMQPKLLSKIRKEGLEKGEEKKKKPLKERQGDWSCPKCRNLNFAFRQICNRCQLPKTEAELMMSGMPSIYAPGMANYPNMNNPGFNYIDSQNLITGNINIFNSFTPHNKGMLYPNMNMMKYMNDPMGNVALPQFPFDQQQMQPQLMQPQTPQQPQQLQSKKGKNSGRQFPNQPKKGMSNPQGQNSPIPNPYTHY